MKQKNKNFYICTKPNRVKHKHLCDLCIVTAIVTNLNSYRFTIQKKEIQVREMASTLKTLTGKGAVGTET